MAPCRVMRSLVSSELALAFLPLFLLSALSFPLDLARSSSSRFLARTSPRLTAASASRIQSASRKVDLGFWLFGNARKNRGECTILVPVDARSIDRRFPKAYYPRNFQFPPLLRAFPRGTLAQLCLIGQDSSDVFSISFKVKSRTCLFIAKRFRVDFSLPHEGEGNCSDETGFLRVSWNETQCLSVDEYMHS